MSDILFSAALVDFAATQVEAKPASEKGRALFAELFGPGAASVTLPKSGAGRFIERLDARGSTHKVSA